MFWNIMNRIHSLPKFEDAEKEELWWNEKEKEMTDLVNYQLSYARPWDKDAVHAFPFLDGCLAPCDGEERGKQVLTLNEGYREFFKEHLGLGSYVGTVTYQGETEQQLHEAWLESGKLTEEDFCDEEEWNEYCEEMDSMDEEEQFNEWLCNLEMEVDTCWIFELGSIMFSHYGRGAGISVRFHQNAIENYNGEQGEELIKLYESL